MSDRSSFLPAAPSVPRFNEAELFALAGFLAGYSGRTYEAYALDTHLPGLGRVPSVSMESV